MIWFSVFSLENKNYTKKSKEKESKKSKEKELSNDVPPEKRKKLHNEVRSLSTTLFFLYLCSFPHLLSVACWQVSGERKKKKGMENDVSIDNNS